jgi:hypothetical protein
VGLPLSGLLAGDGVGDSDGLVLSLILLTTRFIKRMAPAPDKPAPAFNGFGGTIGAQLARPDHRHSRFDAGR